MFRNVLGWFWLIFIFIKFEYFVLDSNTKLLKCVSYFEMVGGILKVDVAHARLIHEVEWYINLGTQNWFERNPNQDRHTIAPNEKGPLPLQHHNQARFIASKPSEIEPFDVVNFVYTFINRFYLSLIFDAHTLFLSLRAFLFHTFPMY